MESGKPGNPYRAPSTRQPQAAMPMDAESFKHSGPGIASCVLNGLIAIAFIILVVIYIAIGGDDMPQESVQMVTLGLLVILLVIVQFAALVLAIIGLCQSQRKKLFAILAMALSCLMVLLWLIIFSMS